MEQIIMVAIALTVGITTALEVITYLLEDKVNKKYYPLISVLVGIVLALLTLLVPEIHFDVSIPGLVLAGVMSGLSASGLYDLTVKPLKKN